MTSFRFLLKAVIFSFLIVTLVSCGIGKHYTPYRPERNGEGYSEAQFDKNLWQVTFKGGSTDEEDSVNYAMLRCAELTLIKGYRYFTVVNKKSSTKNVGVRHDMDTWAYAPGNVSTTGTSRVISKSTAVQNIRMYKKKPGGKNTYDALLICRSLGNKYGVTCQGQGPRIK